MKDAIILFRHNTHTHTHTHVLTWNNHVTFAVNAVHACRRLKTLLCTHMMVITYVSKNEITCIYTVPCKETFDSIIWLKRDILLSCLKLIEVKYYQMHHSIKCHSTTHDAYHTSQTYSLMAAPYDQYDQKYNIVCKRCQ